MLPFHPPTVHFPIALTIFSAGADAVGRVLGVASLRAAGWWGLCGAVLGAAVAAAAGLYDFQRASLGPAATAAVAYHRNVGFIFFALLLGLVFWRFSFFRRDAKPTVRYFLAAAAVVAVVVYQGWLGGELA
jgi:uncharacterized membrane protein